MSVEEAPESPTYEWEKVENGGWASRAYLGDDPFNPANGNRDRGVYAYVGKGERLEQGDSWHWALISFASGVARAFRQSDKLFPEAEEEVQKRAQDAWEDHQENVAFVQDFPFTEQ
ncbi:hypothetical protein ACFL2V_09380 [Pseudomonadota bacterium]